MHINVERKKRFFWSRPKNICSILDKKNGYFCPRRFPPKKAKLLVLYGLKVKKDILFFIFIFNLILTNPM